MSEGKSRGYVRWMMSDTGEIKETAMVGVDIEEDGYRNEWRERSLEIALAIVPDLMDAIDRARLRKQSVEVSVRDCGSADLT